MNDDKREEMNRKIDVLFEQIDKLGEEERQRAAFALSLWNSAKTCEFLGLGPMEARHEYKAAYSELKSMELEVGGMIAPYESSNAVADRPASAGPGPAAG
jgi:hypothetical protein